MADDNLQEKTEQATPKKRQKTRDEGQVAKSMEVSSVFVVLAGILIFFVFARFIYSGITEIMLQSFSLKLIGDIDINYAIRLTRDMVLRFLLILSPIMTAVFFMALATNFMQVGFVISSKAIEPKLNRLDLIKGTKKILSVRSLMELFKSVSKLTIIGLISTYICYRELNVIYKLPEFSPSNIILYFLKGSFKIFIWVLLVMAVLAIIDYLFQKWQFEKQIMMTKQEVKDEYRQLEGDPHVKSRIRSIQTQAARKRMMQEVPEADVIVTNPTHLALAIKYDPLSMAAPKVIAKGAGRIADKIKDLASEHGIPIIENKELARNLYKIVDAGSEVPSQLYMAVAQLLAHVFNLSGKTVR